MAIPYGRQSVDDSDIEAVVRVLRSDWLTIGPVVSEFESAVASAVGAPTAAVVSSGTAALHCAYVGLDLKPGDEVVTTPLTFVATAATAIAEGATIRFADVQSDTGNLDVEAAAAQVSSRTAVIAAVDYAGHPADLDELIELAHANDATLLEDAAHAIGSTYRGRPVGSIADATTFSFFPTKNMTSGEGGAVSSPHAEIVSRAALFRSHGMVRERSRLRHPDEGAWHQEVQSFGLNYRLPDVLSALGVSQLRKLGTFKARRARVFERYAAGLADIDWLTLPTKRDYVDPMWHLYPVRVTGGNRRRVFEFLRAHGVLVQVNYLPAYWHPVFEDLGYKRGQCPNAETYYAEEISLPMYADLSESDQDRVIELLHNALD